MKDKLTIAPVWMWKATFYADADGNIYWKENNLKLNKSKGLVGYPNGIKQYYERVYIPLAKGKGIQVLVHRLLWLLWYEEIPDIVDHINGIKHDNRKVNLRNVTSLENNKNIIKGPRAVRKVTIKKIHSSYAKSA